MIPFLWRRIIIDEVRPREAEALVDIHAGAFSHPWSADDFRALVGERAIFVLAARTESFFGRRRLVGFAIFRQAAGEAELLTIAVRAGNRRSGIGRLLMEAGLRHLYRDRVKALFLEVDRDNAAAVGLYRSLGFQAVGERKGYYRRADGGGGSALVMRLKLD